MGLIFNGNGDVIKAVDGSLTVEGLDFGGISNVNAGIGTFSGNLNVGGVLTYEDVKNVDSVGVITARAGINLTGGNITLGDSGGNSDDKLVFGAGGDLKIFHNGSNNYIDAPGTGHLYIRPEADFLVQDFTTGEVRIKANNDDAVELYFNGNKKLETTNTGATVTGDITISDKIIHAGDTNTAIRFPAADVFTAETGGSERLRCDGDGVKVHNGRFYSAGTFAYIESSSTSNATVTLRKTASGADAIDYLQLRDNSNALKLKIGGDGIIYTPDVLASHDGDTNTKIRFPAADTVTVETAGTERLRITSDGQIGVNNTSPDAWYSTYRSIQIYDGAVLYGSADDSFVGLGANHFLNTSGDFKYSNTDFASRFYQVNGGFHFESAASGTAGNTFSFTEKFLITSAGKIGIGEAAPTNMLHVKAGDTGVSSFDSRYHITVENNGESYLAFYAPDNSYAGVRFHDTTGAEGYIDYYFNTDEMHYYSSAIHKWTANGSERLRITSGGSVRIGGSTPVGYSANANVDDIVVGGTSSHGITILTGNSATGSLWFDSENGNRGYIQYPHNEEALILGTEGNERLRINSTGAIVKQQFTATNTYATNDTTQCGYQAQNLSNTTNTYAALRLTAGSSSPATAQIASIRTGAGQNDLTFQLESSNTAFEALRITSGGDICIGRTSAVVADSKLNIQCDATKPAIAIQCGHTNTDTDLITAWNSGGKNIVNITAETDNSPYLKFEILSGNSPVERFRVNHLGNVSIGGGTAPNRLEIIDDHQGFPSDSAQPHASLLIKHGTSGSNRRWVGIGASLTGAWLQSSSPGGSGLSAPFWINKGGGDVTLGNDRLKVTSSGDVCIGATAPVSAEKLYVLNGSAVSGRSIDPLTAVLFESAECRLQLQSDNTGNNASTIILSNDNKHWMIQQRATGKSNNFQIGYYAGTAGDLSNLSSYALQIKTNGVAQFSTTGSFDTYTTADNAYQFRHDFTNVAGVWISNTNTSHTKELLRLDSARSGSSSFDLATFTTGNLGDDQFRFRGDGNAYSDGGYWASAADYAEYFEWTDGNSSDEDRRGMTVVLDGNKVKLSTSSDSADNIIGVVSANPVVVGDSAYMAWTDKYLKDEYGAYDLDENGERKLNPSYDDTKTYVTREDRKEWDTIGMVGKLRIRKGQKTGTRWIKMRDISDSIEEWLVR